MSDVGLLKKYAWFRANPAVSLCRKDSVITLAQLDDLLDEVRKDLRDAFCSDCTATIEECPRCPIVKWFGKETKQ